MPVNWTTNANYQMEQLKRSKSLSDAQVQKLRNNVDFWASALGREMSKKFSEGPATIDVKGGPNRVLEVTYQ
jgi:hypothetical protein